MEQLPVRSFLSKKLPGGMTNRLFQIRRFILGRRLCMDFRQSGPVGMAIAQRISGVCGIFGNTGAASLRAGDMRFCVAAGAVAAMATVWLLFGSPDLSVTVNGTLGGLVAIGSRYVSVPPAAALVGGASSGVVFVSGIGPVDRNGTGDLAGVVAPRRRAEWQRRRFL